MSEAAGPTCPALKQDQLRSCLTRDPAREDWHILRRAGPAEVPPQNLLYGGKAPSFLPAPNTGAVILVLVRREQSFHSALDVTR